MQNNYIVWVQLENLSHDPANCTAGLGGLAALTTARDRREASFEELKTPDVSNYQQPKEAN